MQNVLTVLFVCTGNVCRSPAAAALATVRTPPGTPIEYASAGLAALVGEPLDGPVAGELAALGVPESLAAAHRARQYEPWMTLDAGLVLTATQAQAQQVLRDVPQALRRVFTIKEFARLAAQHDPVTGAAATVAAVAAMRGLVPVVPGEQDDVRDPFRRTQADAKSAVDDIATALDATLAALAPPRRRPLPFRR